MPRKALPIEERFWKYVAKSSGCWLWTGALKDNGYGVLNVGRKRGTIKAHRLSWMIHFGPIPAGRLVCHRCDVRKCVSPNHLFLGTYLDNNLDMTAKGRHGSVTTPPKTHCKQGHPMTPENTRILPSGHRACKECSRISARRYYAQKRH